MKFMKKHLCNVRPERVFAVILILFSLDSAIVWSLDEPGIKGDPKSNLEQRTVFLSQLKTWADNNNIYVAKDFQLDRRFGVDACPTSYYFRPQKNSTIIAASCTSNDWTKHINLKRKNSSYHFNKDDESTVSVWVMKNHVAKGSKINVRDLVRKSVEKRFAPRNYWKKTNDDNIYAKVVLRPNKILNESDVYQAETGLIAITSIPVGTNIGPDMVTLKEITSPTNGNVFKRLADLKYFETNKNIETGTPIKFGDLKKAKLVKRGEKVVVLARGNGFEIKSTTEALKDGYFGDQVTMSAPDGAGTISGRVAGKNLVTALK